MKKIDIELFYKFLSEHFLAYSQFTIWKPVRLGEEKSKERNYIGCCQLHGFWVG